MLLQEKGQAVAVGLKEKAAKKLEHSAILDIGHQEVSKVSRF